MSVSLNCQVSSPEYTQRATDASTGPIDIKMLGEKEFDDFFENEFERLLASSTETERAKELLKMISGKKINNELRERVLLMGHLKSLIALHYQRDLNVELNCSGTDHPELTLLKVTFHFTSNYFYEDSEKVNSAQKEVIERLIERINPREAEDAHNDSIQVENIADVMVAKFLAQSS
ncbi:hypothetical protein D5R81_01445 [Parashewanella spongiae]|uniref:Uncharacterized protein n=1 Tax=Parashewanella spongiae TaxID=342950 RepID=A0A3A6UCD0_9GAMM|nr:hypothetical protein [Parashewanella spongiae]MCL1076788.1 hypothetical protein [Parashewanella spongiae]RJY19287.1 hypothetical protein D5R81_01445 [Parashewanella spongiae]